MTTPEYYEPQPARPETYVPTADFDTFVSQYHGGDQPFTADGRLAAGKGADAAYAALGYVGTPFTWGGGGRGGMDSANLVREAYRAIGVDLPRLSDEQARAGERIPLDALQPGDLVAWDAYDRVGGAAPHAAVHVGGGYVVEAPGPGLNVRLRPLDEHDAAAYGVRPLDPNRFRSSAPFERER